MKKILVIALALISGNLFAGFDWGGNCDSGNNSFTDSIPYRQTKTVGDIPLNKKNIRIELNSEVDVDVQLVDLDNNKEIIAWPNGLLSGATEACTTYEGVEYCYSGYNGTDGKKGHEWIEIHGVTNHKLRMKAYGYVAGDATINYSWEAVDTCNEKGSGTFNQDIPLQDTVEVGKIPAGKVNVRIDLTADNDVDVQLWDGTKPIIAWSSNNSLGALLYGASQEQATYKNMTIIYSGYNGVNGNPGKEFIEIKGEVSTELTMKAFGYASGNATVDYSWGNGAGETCGGSTGVDCESGFLCKHMIGVTGAGTCHTKTWCLSDETAESDCENLVLPEGKTWKCENFECVAQGNINPQPEQCGGFANLSCPDGLFCKLNGNTGWGTCHSENWCGSNETAESDCSNLVPTTSYGNWECVNNVCSWNAQDSTEPQTIEDKLPGDFNTNYLHFCTTQKPCSTINVKVCSENDVSCNPTNQYTISWTINNKPVSNFLMRFNNLPNGYHIYSSDNNSLLTPYNMVDLNASKINLNADISDLTLTYFQIPLSSNSININFDESSLKTNEGETYFISHPAFPTNITPVDVHKNAVAITKNIDSITQMPHVYFKIFYMPTEYAVYGDGNFSMANGLITINYGNKPWIDGTNKTVESVTKTETSHEYTHQIFAESKLSKIGAASCLNEGLADAVGNYLGYISDENFGYVSSTTNESEFKDGCQNITQEIHHQGNCVLWYVKKKGYFSNQFFNNLFHIDPETLLKIVAFQNTYDTCSLNDKRTGDMYIVLFSEAAGTDVTDAITAAKIPNSGSLQAAKANLGL